MGSELVLDREQNEMKFPFEKAYARIVEVEIAADRDEVHIHVAIYADQAARNAKACSILKKTVQAKLSDFAPKDFTKDGVKAAAWAFLNTQKIPFGNSRILGGPPMPGQPDRGPEAVQPVIDFTTGKAVL
jgi:hypothetical protein